MLSTTLVLRRFFVAHSTSPGRSRTVHGSCTNLRQHDPAMRSPVAHGTENYFVDSDDTPPPNASVYKVDAASDTAKSAYEPPSGPWSREGADTEEYHTTSKDGPYDVPSGKHAKLRHGGTKKDKGLAMSNAGEGPEGAGRLGHKPEA